MVTETDKGSSVVRTSPADKLGALCHAVELAVDRRLLTPKDFDLLSERVWIRTGEMVSRNTLRRIWGRISDDTSPRPSTLGILSRFVGYRDYDAFCRGCSDAGTEASLTFMGRRLSVVNGLQPGDRVRLTWQPDRVCDVVYNGSMHFRVTHSERTRLKEGDTFLCALIVEGQPLYLDQLQQTGQPPTTYICGRLSGGVRFELMKEC